MDGAVVGYLVHSQNWLVLGLLGEGDLGVRFWSWLDGELAVRNILEGTNPVYVNVTKGVLCKSEGPTWFSKAVVGKLDWFLESEDVGVIWSLFYRRHWNLGEVISKNSTIVCLYFSCDRMCFRSLVYVLVKAGWSSSLATSKTCGTSPILILGRETSCYHVELSFCQMIMKECSYIIQHSPIIFGTQQSNADLQSVSEIAKPTLAWCVWLIIVLMLTVAWQVVPLYEIRFACPKSSQHSPSHTSPLLLRVSVFDSDPPPSGVCTKGCRCGSYSAF